MNSTSGFEGNTFFYSNAPDIPMGVSPLFNLRIVSSIISKQRLHRLKMSPIRKLVVEAFTKSALLAMFRYEYI